MIRHTASKERSATRPEIHREGTNLTPGISIYRQRTAQDRSAVNQRFYKNIDKYLLNSNGIIHGGIIYIKHTKMGNKHTHTKICYYGEQSGHLGLLHVTCEAYAVTML